MPVTRSELQQLPAPLLSPGATSAKTGAPDSSSVIEVTVLQIKVLWLQAPDPASLLEVRVPGASPAGIGAPGSSSTTGG